MTDASDSPTFSTLPRDLLCVVLNAIDLHTLARTSCVSQEILGAVQRVLRERAVISQPTDNLVVLFWRERRNLHAHAAGTIACGDLHSVCAIDGSLYSFGTDDNERGYLGHGVGAAAAAPASAAEFALPTRVPVAMERFVAVATHSLHTLALTASGCVYSFGHGDCGKLGHGNLESLWQPRLIEALVGEQAVAISAGQQHSLVLTSTGALFSFGSGFGGKLGHGDQRNCTRPLQLTMIAPKDTRALREADGPSEDAGEPVAQGGGDDNAPMPLACVAAGTHHSLVATNAEGLVYSFGSGASWQLGHGLRQDEHAPRRIDSLVGTRIVQLAGGEHHSLAVDDDGRVYSWGAGEARERSSTWRFGWLGHRTTDEQRLPRQICGLCHVRVVSIAAGSRHSLVLADGGAVYSFGDGDGGQLGVGSDELGAGRMLWVPTRIRALDELGEAMGEAPAAATAAGNTELDHASDSRRVALGAPAHGPPARARSRSRRRVVAISAGEAHSLCRFEDGSVASWGCGAGLGLEGSALSDHAADQPVSWGSAGNHEWSPSDQARRWQARLPSLLRPFTSARPSR